MHLHGRSSWVSWPFMNDQPLGTHITYIHPWQSYWKAIKSYTTMCIYNFDLTISHIMKQDGAKNQWIEKENPINHVGLC